MRLRMTMKTTTIPLNGSFSYTTKVNGDIKYINEFVTFRRIEICLYIVIHVSTPKFSENDLARYFSSLRKIAS